MTENGKRTKQKATALISTQTAPAMKENGKMTNNTVSVKKSGKMEQSITESSSMARSAAKGR